MVLKTCVFLAMMAQITVILNDLHNPTTSIETAAPRTTPTIPPYELPSSTSVVSAGKVAKEALPTPLGVKSLGFRFRVQV